MIPCRDLKQFLAGSTRKSSNFSPFPRCNSRVLEAHIAGSANWKLSFAANLKAEIKLFLMPPNTQYHLHHGLPRMRISLVPLKTLAFILIMTLHPLKRRAQTACVTKYQIDRRTLASPCTQDRKTLEVPLRSELGACRPPASSPSH